jgi:hypothetical protein
MLMPIILAMYAHLPMPILIATYMSVHDHNTGFRNPLLSAHSGGYIDTPSITIILSIYTLAGPITTLAIYTNRSMHIILAI